MPTTDSAAAFEITSGPDPTLHHEPTPAGRDDPVGVAIDVLDLSQHAGNREILRGVSLSIRPGELVALAGASGSGKTTLLETIAGLRRPTSGTVTYDGRPEVPGAGDLGFVPQDDIIHRALPLRRTLRYAARLRLPAAFPAEQIDGSVDQTLRNLELSEHGDTRVADLSGGQRKRASVAVELLTRPRLLLLDEPTSGLDPATSAEVMSVLRRLTDHGVTVVLTTHDPADIDACDHVVFLAPRGHVAFSGTPAEARRHFAVSDLARVYHLLGDDESSSIWAEPAKPAKLAKLAKRVDSPAEPAKRPEPAKRADSPGEPVRRRSTPPTLPVAPAVPPRPRIGALRQCALLTLRNADVLVRSRLTLAVLLGSPLLVISMMALLFRPGGFAASRPGSLGPVQTLFWMAFAAFFFGLTYGLLQIVGERSVFRRERLAGLSVVAYVAAKVVVLLPVLAGVNLVMLGVLRSFDRLPAAGADTYARLLATLLVASLCSLTLGLLTSASVADAAQATLALPMLCFPQVLFAGAVVPVAEMTAPGRVISAGMANRWTFEALGRTLRTGGLGPTSPATAAYGHAFMGSALSGFVVLASLAGAFAVTTVLVLTRRTRR
jgi:ABC-type multidrug transport system ATPase subunit